MHLRTPHHPALAWLLGLVLMASSGWAVADPPSRVARLGYISGTVSFSPAGEDDWVRATVNRPLGSGDRLWSQPDSRAEVQVGGAMLRMSADTAVSVLNLDDQITQLQLTQGALHVRVRRLEVGQAVEVDTPNLAFTLRQPGAYRIEVDPASDTTTIHVRSGQGEVYGEDAAYVIDSRQAYRFAGTGLRDYQLVESRDRDDDFDRWASDRDRRYDGSISARYVSADVIGYQDLDTNGRWRVDATYGNVWMPNNVSAGWAPYQNGHWAWIDPWGWTWIDDAPWGFAVSHYGRWAHIGGSWGWVPGPPRSRAYYAPALVVFIGGDNFQLTISSGSVGGVGWFPLAPREIYRPAYPVSRGYFENLNRSNTVITNTTVINNYYDNSTTINKTVYVNRQVAGAVVAVPATTFVQSQPVARAAVKLPRDRQAAAAVVATAPVAPTRASVRGAAVEVAKPPATVFERRVVARTEPAPAKVGFEAQERQLKVQPGKPLDDDARRELKPKAVSQAPVVKLIERRQEAPKARPEAPSSAGRRPANDAAAADRPEAAAPASAPSGRQGDRPAVAAPPRDRDAARDDTKPRDRDAARDDTKPRDRDAVRDDTKPRDRDAARDEAKPRDRDAASDTEPPRGRPTARPPAAAARPASDPGRAPSDGDRPPLKSPPGRPGEVRPPAGAASTPSLPASAVPAERAASEGERGRDDKAPGGPR